MKQLIDTAMTRGIIKEIFSCINEITGRGGGAAGRQQSGENGTNTGRQNHRQWSLIPDSDGILQCVPPDW